MWPLRRVRRVDPFRFPDEAEWKRIEDPTTHRLVPVAPFASASQALNRARSIAAGELRELRLFPGHGNHWPLWDQGGPAEPLDLGLSSALAQRLRAWCDDWFSIADDPKYADEEATLHLTPEWFTEGELLTPELAIEVWEHSDVIPLFRRHPPT